MLTLTLTPTLTLSLTLTLTPIPDQVGLQLLGPRVVHPLLLPACPAYLAELDAPLGLAGTWEI